MSSDGSKRFRSFVLRFDIPKARDGVGVLFSSIDNRCCSVKQRRSTRVHRGIERCSIFLVTVSAPGLVRTIGSDGGLYGRTVGGSCGRIGSVRAFLARLSSGRNSSTGLMVFIPLGYRG